MDLYESIIKKHGSWGLLKNQFLNYKIHSMIHWYSRIHLSLQDEYLEKMKISLSLYRIEDFDRAQIDVNAFKSICNKSIKTEPLKPKADTQESKPVLHRIQKSISRGWHSFSGWLSRH